ncbi:hypothetical protein T484DRAFT_1831966 [Baffinella frigidus]|nr:hypothetical protein T484DRAFT_1831966 [Cryptophyta sp. CCMP2293]
MLMPRPVTSSAEALSSPPPCIQTAERIRAQVLYMRMAAALGECGAPARAYGACVAALGNTAEMGSCNREFDSLRKCFLLARKRAGK